MGFRERVRANVNKSIATLNVVVSDASITKLVEQAFGIVTDTRISWGRCESRPNNHGSAKTAQFVTGNCPGLVEDCKRFAEQCITESVIKEAQKAIDKENTSKYNKYNRVIDVAGRFFEDFDKKVNENYKAYVETIARAYAVRDAKKIYETARGHFLKQG